MINNEDKTIYGDRLFTVELIHDLFRKHLGIDLCWADCVQYSHQDKIQEEISLCKGRGCNYCGKWNDE